MLFVSQTVYFKQRNPTEQVILMNGDEFLWVSKLLYPYRLQFEIPFISKNRQNLPIEHWFSQGVAGHFSWNFDWIFAKLQTLPPPKEKRGGNP